MAKITTNNDTAPDCVFVLMLFIITSVPYFPALTTRLND